MINISLKSARSVYKPKGYNKPLIKSETGPESRLLFVSFFNPYFVKYYNNVYFYKPFSLSNPIKCLLDQG
jgi:hypothetical protein